MIAQPSCLLVIPSFRDATRLAPFLTELMQKLPAGFWIRVVDDGSGPRAATETKALVNKTRTDCAREAGPDLLDPLILPQNLGKGAAVYSGWRAGPATDCVAFVDADGAVSADELIRTWKSWPELNADAVIASRIKMLGRDVNRLAARHYAGRVFATLVSLLTGLEVYDSQCGFKLLRREAFLNADRMGLEASRLAFDVELLVTLARSNCRIVEFPVDWRDVAGGKVSLIRHAVPMFYELLKIRRRHGRLES
jgi:glycosyltransferase involved in cell wall biosynthesis